MSPWANNILSRSWGRAGFGLNERAYSVESSLQSISSNSFLWGHVPRQNAARICVLLWCRQQDPGCGAVAWKRLRVPQERKQRSCAGPGRYSPIGSGPGANGRGHVARTISFVISFLASILWDKTNCSVLTQTRSCHSKPAASARAWLQNVEESMISVYAWLW